MMLYPWITLAIRASVCVLLFRINSKRSYLWYIRVILAANTIFSIIFFFILLFQCSPPQYFWRRVYGESGHCYDRSIVGVSATVYGVLSALSDWSLGLLPIAILWSVQMNLRTKVAIGGLLGLGVMYVCSYYLSKNCPWLTSTPLFSAGIAPVVRIVFITRLQPGLRFLYEAT